jgi:hypothetical protein
MTNDSQDKIKFQDTLLEIINHAITQHPELGPHVEAIALKAKNKENVAAMSDWATREYRAPSPPSIKSFCLLRNNLPNSTWIETGTLYGDTSDLLSRCATKVITIEPEPKLFANAVERFRSYSNVMVINGISEVILPKVLPTLTGNVCFWLDGHYSAGETFAGPNDTPLVEELRSIAQNINRYDAVSILIDDIRFCGRMHAYGAYPSLDYLVDFARSNNLGWYIEHDIFIARTKPNPM